MSTYGLTPLTTGFMTNNNTNITTGPISNEFATAAFRMGHTLVQEIIQYEFDQSLTSYST